MAYLTLLDKKYLSYKNKKTWRGAALFIEKSVHLQTTGVKSIINTWSNRRLDSRILQD